MVNHTLLSPSRLDAQPVLSLREVNSFIEEQIQRLPGRKRDKNRQRVNIPTIASLDSRKYRGQVMVSTIRKAKLKLRWSPEQISLRIDALLADQTLKDTMAGQEIWGFAPYPTWPSTVTSMALMAI